MTHNNMIPRTIANAKGVIADNQQKIARIKHQNTRTELEKRANKAFAIIQTGRIEEAHEYTGRERDENGRNWHTYTAARAIGTKGTCYTITLWIPDADDYELAAPLPPIRYTCTCPDRRAPLIKGTKYCKHVIAAKTLKTARRKAYGTN
ncbi:MAG: hypothetical protein CUN56_00100 [Phototrophicales bacterium]|nr:MAG: hypothetical protein CUN56_00100 [Phototrophicales bacterium]